MMQKNKKYSNLTPAEIAKLKKALEYGVKKNPLREKQYNEKLRKETLKEARQKTLKKIKQEISKPSKSMMMDTTTDMGANIFIIPKKKSGTNKNKKKN